MQALGERFRGAGHGHFLAAINRSQPASWRQSQWKLASSIDFIWATRAVSASSSASFPEIPGDDHSLAVFDPAVRGRTDQVVLRFRRPR
jgi:hypothetical protein